MAAKHNSDMTWIEQKEDIIVLKNLTSNNYILELPSGRFRLDGGRRMRTLRSILDLAQVKQLVSDGKLTVESRR